VSRRAIALVIAGSLVFILIGVAGLSLAFSRIGCPDRIQWRDLSYLPVGSPLPSPDTGDAGAPAKLGTTFIGLTTRDIYGPAGSSRSPEAAARPTVIAMDCGDGTFLKYRQAGPVPTATPSATPGG
jgi:hypothetical protein